MEEPLIDILMATYNGEHFIADQIMSIQRQTYKNWHLLISDDCSNDGTLDVIQRFVQSDTRIQVVSEGVKHGGAKENFFALMDFSKAPYCMFCDQDDVWLPEKVEKTLKFVQDLEGHESGTPILAFTDMRVVDAKLNAISASFEQFSSIDPSRTKFPQVIAQSLGAGCTMMTNAAAREIASQVKDIDDVIMHDWWLSLVAAAFGRIGYLDESTSLYRQHGSNEVGALEYSPIKRASHFDQMRESVSATVRQVQAFSACYGSLLNDGQREAIDEFIACGNTKGLPSVAHLIKSGCWKKGLRVLGQVAVCVRGC